MMQVKAIAQSVSLGLAVGTACYLLTGSSARQKRKVRRCAGQAMRAVGSMMEGVSDMMR